MLEKVLASQSSMGIWFQQLDEIIPYPWGYLLYMFVWGTGIAMAGFFVITLNKRDKRNKKDKKNTKINIDK